MRQAYRISAIFLLNRGRSLADMGGALRFDPDTTRGYFRRYTQGGLGVLLHMGYVTSKAWLDVNKLNELDAHMQEHLYDTAEAVTRYVKRRRGIRYSPSGVPAVHNLLLCDQKGDSRVKPAAAARGSERLRRELRDPHQEQRR